MNALVRALRPIVRRIRLLRAAQALQFSLALFLLAAAFWLLIARLSPIEDLAGRILRSALPPLPLICFAAYAWPVPARFAARRADECGLMERAQTALEIEGSRAMDALLREDAIRALASLDLRQRLPARLRKPPAIASMCLCALIAVLSLLPNPQDAVLAERKSYREEMERQAASVEEMAREVAQSDLDEQRKAEIDRLLAELSRKLRDSLDRRDALEALDEAQVSLSNLDRQASAALSAASDALSQAGLSAMASAMARADAQALEEALAAQMDEGKADAAAEALGAAAEAAAQAEGGELAGALSALSAAASSGNTSSAQSMTGRTGRAMSAGMTGNLSALLSTLRSAATCLTGNCTGSSGSAQGSGGNGQGSGNGQSQGQGQGTGSGAGKGSTNLDAGTSAESGKSSGGANAREDHGFKTGAYEQIYDPERLGDGGQISQAQGEVREGEDAQIDLSPGAGSLDGYVPYDEVIGSYAERAAQAAQEDALPARQRQWVADYFDALTD